MAGDFRRAVDFAGMRAKARALWDELPERGWPIGVVAGFLKAPPKRLVAAALLSALVVVLVLFVRLLIALVAGDADEVNKFLLGLAGLLSVPFLVWRTRIADQQKTIAQEELFTGLLVKAVEQLGATREEKTYEIPKIEDDLFGGRPNGMPVKRESVVRTVPNTEVRLGAIYALEKLARDYLPLHWQVMEILCAYVRKNAGPPRPASEEIREIYAKHWPLLTDNMKKKLMAHECEWKPLFVDVQAALTVIGRRSKKQRDWEKQKRNEADGIGKDAFRLDLSACHLATITIAGLHFERAIFSGSCLERAVLMYAHLEGARLGRAHLEGVRLHGAHLEDAFLYETHLEGAWLEGAHLEGAWLPEAHLEGAFLVAAAGMTQDQLDQAFGDEKTILPEGLTRPVNERWRRDAAGQGDGG